MKRRGEIRWAGLREVVFFKSMISKIKHEFSKVSGKVARTIIYRASYEYTKKTIDNLLSTKLNTLIKKVGVFDRKIAEEMLPLLAQRGYGKGELVKWDPPEEVVVNVKNSYESDYYIENSIDPKKPTCDALRGIFAAAMSSITDEGMIAEDTRCRALGHDHCEFHIRKKE